MNFQPPEEDDPRDDDQLMQAAEGKSTMMLKPEDAPLFSLGADWAAACHAADWPTPSAEQQVRIDETRAAFLEVCNLIQGAFKDSHGAVLLAEAVLSTPGFDGSATDEASLDIEPVAQAVYEASSNLWMTNAPYDELHADDKAECRSIAHAALAAKKRTRGHMGSTADGGIDDH
ncbi:hypothetical protein RD110_18790 [Rhodoferax koreense]|uniref:Uncharacterized protein n=1 Tax=Rhodoferax koreensis TaxID=1842727 RepID=A0A1P8JZ18_9BURK|nr:hypothetical protein [Rhodoferax koreense]APW39002.1 hypothetical protein RD110_18790 [Rhodoferax koreense]